MFTFVFSFSIQEITLHGGKDSVFWLIKHYIPTVHYVFDHSGYVKYIF